MGGFPFDGDFARRKVNLAGNSRAAESAAQVLERTRREREHRARSRAETKAAVAVQAAWRGHAARRHARLALRQAWAAQFGSAGAAAGDPAAAAALLAAPGFLPPLLHFADPADEGDVASLAAAARLAVVPAPGAAPPQPLLCSLAGGAGPEAAQAVVARAAALAALAVEALAAHFGGALALPRSALAQRAAAGDAAAACAAPLVEAAVALVAPESWAPALGPGAPAAAAVACVLARVAARGGLGALPRLVAAGCPEAGPAAGGVPAAEALAAALSVRCLSRERAVADAVARTARGRAADPVQRQLAALLCVPLLGARCASLRPVAPRLVLAAAAALGPLPAADLAAWLPAGLPCGLGRAGAGAALLGNTLEHAAPALRLAGERAAGEGAADARRRAGLGLAALIDTLLQLLPERPLFSADAGWAADGDDDTEAEAEQRALVERGAAAPLLAWPPDEMAPAPLLAQLQLLYDSVSLAALAGAVLPATTAEAGEALVDAAAAAAAAAGSPGPPADGARLAALHALGADARRLCALLRRAAAPRGRRAGVLIGLAVAARLPERLWFSLLRPAHARGGAAWAPAPGAAGEGGDADPGWMAPVALFADAYAAHVAVADDDEVYGGRPLPAGELGGPRGALSLLKSALWQVLWAEAPPPRGWPRRAAAARGAVRRAAARLMSALHSRNTRRPFVAAEAFHAEGLPLERFHAAVAAAAAEGRLLVDADDDALAAAATGGGGGAGAALSLLAHAPFLVPFPERARVFQAVVAAERERARAATDAGFFGGGGGERFVAVRRGHVLEDGFAGLGAGGVDLRGRVRVRFVSGLGFDEAGVDGGGLFKDFLAEVVREGFDPGAGLFAAAEGNRLYPRPDAPALVPGAPRLLEFLGKMVGKAMLEGVLLELPLAPFFLKAWRGARADLGDLPSLDPQLAASLAALKRAAAAGADVGAWGLAFTAGDEVAGARREVELVPGGADVPVTAANALEYVHRLADWRLNRAGAAPTAAFLAGLHSLVPPRWLRMFAEEELQALVAGALGDAGLDVADMRAHAVYAGGYADGDATVDAFWAVVASLSPRQQAALLRFVTSCPRPPLLGFRYLHPPLAIQRAGGAADAERLPTAATCANLLKLPDYLAHGGDAAKLRAKLLMAVESGAGFELS